MKNEEKNVFGRSFRVVSWCLNIFTIFVCYKKEGQKAHFSSLIITFFLLSCLCFPEGTENIQLGEELHYYENKFNHEM